MRWGFGPARTVPPFNKRGSVSIPPGISRTGASRVPAPKRRANSQGECVPLSDERAVPDANPTNPASGTNKGPELNAGALGAFEIRFQGTLVADG